MQEAIAYGLLGDFFLLFEEDFLSDESQKFRVNIAGDNEQKVM